MRWSRISLAATLGLSAITEAAYISHAVDVMADHQVVSDLQVQQRPNLTEAIRILQERQEGARCGATGGNARCPSNLCCSQFGYCGEGALYCSDIVGCQPQFGRCGDAPPEPSTTTTTRPPPPPTTTTTTTPPPPPPSSTTSTRTASSSSTTAVIPSPPAGMQISLNGMCGNTTTCAGSRFGRCCSQFWWCGDSTEFCGDGCNSRYGTCGGAVSSSSVVPTSTSSSSTQPPTTTSARPTSSSTSSAPPAVSLPPGVTRSTDGSCGNGKSCAGTNFGPCCSQFGFCGSGDNFCPEIVGCQVQFSSCCGSNCG